MCCKYCRGLFGGAAGARQIFGGSLLLLGFDIGVISKNVFTMLLLMAVFSTVITVPALRRC